MTIYWKYTNPKDEDDYLIYERNTVTKEDRCVYDSNDSSDLPALWNTWGYDTEEAAQRKSDYTLEEITSDNAFLEMI